MYIHIHMPARGAIHPMCAKIYAVSAQRQQSYAQKQHVSHICAETQRSAAHKRNDVMIRALCLHKCQKHALCRCTRNHCNTLQHAFTATHCNTHSQRAIQRRMRKDTQTCTQGYALCLRRDSKAMRNDSTCRIYARRRQDMRTRAQRHALCRISLRAQM